MYVKRGTGTRTRYLSISKVPAVPGHDVCTSLLELHLFTGCDTVSAFNGQGKLASLKLLMTRNYFRDVFIKLGDKLQLADDIFKVLEEFACCLHVIHP